MNIGPDTTPGNAPSSGGAARPADETQELFRRLRWEHLREAGLPEAAPPVCPILKLLKGQKALVTGASSGIGRGIAIALAHAGADVAINYASSSTDADAAAEEARRCGSAALVHKADITSEAQVESMFATVIERLGTIDILVNNAGIQDDAPFESMTLDQWNRVLAVNLTGQFLCAREAVREFRRRGIRPGISCAAGKIIFISSVHDLIPWAGHVNYAASKGGLAMLMRSLAQEVAPHRIRVNSISPGAIRTGINTDAWSTPEAYRELMRLIPCRRIGEPDDIGRATVWLASDDSDYVHGTTLYVDGGMTLYPGFASGG